MLSCKSLQWKQCTDVYHKVQAWYNVELHLEQVMMRAPFSSMATTGPLLSHTAVSCTMLSWPGEPPYTYTHVELQQSMWLLHIVNGRMEGTHTTGRGGYSLSSLQKCSSETQYRIHVQNTCTYELYSHSRNKTKEASRPLERNPEFNHIWGRQLTPITGNSF